ncbi:FERM PH-like domain protein [Cooperia oncophora]
MAALALKVDKGNNPGGYFRAEQYFPIWVIDVRGLEYVRKYMPAASEDLKEMSRVEAMMKFAFEASRSPFALNCHLYGLRRHKMDTVDNAVLGINAKGIEMCDIGDDGERIPLRSLPWNRVTRLSFDRKKLTIVGADTTKMCLYAQSESKARYLLELCRAVHQTLLVLSHQNGKIAPLPQLFQEKSVDRVSTSSNNTTIANNCDNDKGNSGDRGQGSVSSKQRVRIKLDSNLDLKIEKMELEHIRQERAASQSSKTSDASDQVERRLTTAEADSNDTPHDFIAHPVVEATNMYVNFWSPFSLLNHSHSNGAAKRPFLATAPAFDYHVWSNIANFLKILLHIFQTTTDDGPSGSLLSGFPPPRGKTRDPPPYERALDIQRTTTTQLNPHLHLQPSVVQSIAVGPMAAEAAGGQPAFPPASATQFATHDYLYDGKGLSTERLQRSCPMMHDVTLNRSIFKYLKNLKQEQIFCSWSKLFLESNSLLSHQRRPSSCIDLTSEYVTHLPLPVLTGNFHVPLHRGDYFPDSAVHNYAPYVRTPNVMPAAYAWRPTAPAAVMDLPPPPPYPAGRKAPMVM